MAVGSTDKHGDRGRDQSNFKQLDMKENDDIKLRICADAKAAYLYGLGKAISNLTPKVKSGYWFNADSEFDKRTKMIKQIHESAMEVLRLEK